MKMTDSAGSNSAIPPLTAATLGMMFIAGVVATIAFDTWGQLISPALGFANLSPHGLAKSLLGALGLPNSDFAGYFVHFYLVGLIGYPIGWLFVFRPIWNAVIGDGIWIVPALIYGFGLWVFAIGGITAIAGLPFFLGFTGITWVALVGHVLYGVVMVAVMQEDPPGLIPLRAARAVAPFCAPGSGKPRWDRAGRTTHSPGPGQGCRTGLQCRRCNPSAANSQRSAQPFCAPPRGPGFPLLTQRHGTRTPLICVVRHLGPVGRDRMVPFGGSRAVDGCLGVHASKQVVKADRILDGLRSGRNDATRLCNKRAHGANWKAMMALENDPWGQLLMAANQGDARAYTRFLQTVTPVLRGIVRAKSAGLGEAACEDVLQEVLLAIHLKRHTWHPAAPVRPWLYAITRYKVVDAFRARGRRIDLPIEDFADVLAAEAGPDPTEAADMAKMIGMLDGRSVAVVRKIGLEGASVAETGQALKMSDGAVRVALHRALKSLAILRERHVE